MHTRASSEYTEHEAAPQVAELKGIVDASGFLQQKVRRSAQGDLVLPALRSLPTFGSTRQSKAVGSTAVLWPSLGR